MALIGLRGGGEHGNLVGWAASGAVITVDTSTILTGMGGPASIKHDGSATTVCRFAFAGGTTEYSTVYFSFKLMLPVVSAPAGLRTTRWMLTNNGNLNVGGFQLEHSNTTGQFSIRPLDSNLVLQGSAVSANHFVAGQTHVISGKFVAGASGSISLNIDGVSVIPTTTINTTISYAAGTAAGFSMSLAVVSGARVFHYGDFIFDDADYPDPAATVIARQFKAGTPTYDAFATVGGGTKYGNISQSPPSATLAIASASTTAAVAQTALINSFASTETGKGAGTIGASDTILGIRAEAWVKTSATSSGGAAGSIRLRTGGVDTDTAITLTTSDVFRQSAVKTGVSLTDLNAGEAGWAKTASASARVHTVEDVWVVAAYAPPAGPLPDRVGDLAATETGSDTAAIDADVLVAGTLAATESGADTAAISGTVAWPDIAATLAATEVGSDSAALSAAVEVTGTLAASEAASDTAALGGSVEVRGSLAATEVGPDTAAINLGQMADIVGTLAAQETGSDSAAASGSVAVSAALAAQEVGPDTAALTISVTVSANIGAVEVGSDTAAVAATVRIAASLAAVEVGADTAIIAGGQQPGIAATLAAQEAGADTASISGTLGPQPITGTLAAQETGSDTTATSIAVGVAAALSATEAGSDSASIGAAVAITGTLAAQEVGSDTAAIGVSRNIEGSLAAQEQGSDTAAILAVQGSVSGALTVQEQGSDSAAIVGRLEPIVIPRPPLAPRHHMATDFQWPHIHVPPFQPDAETIHWLNQKARPGHHMASDWMIHHTRTRP